MPSNQFVFRSDVKSYYASIDHAVLLGLVRERIDDPRMLDLVGQYLHNGAGIYVPRVLDYAKRRDRRCAFSLARISRTCGSAL